MNDKFESYFSTVFKDRWPVLREALLQEEKQVAYASYENNPQEVLSNPNLFLAGSEDRQKRTEEGFLKSYILDPASLLPVLALDLKDGQSVLDLCSAPGGKSLAILGQITPSGNLTANDSSKDRLQRLKKVLREYSPEKFRERFFVTLSDGRTFFKTKKQFDRVLVDAPCSSERHLLKNEKLLMQWTPKQAESLSIKQYTLLCTALLCTYADGFVVYSTCSINPVENDNVIGKVLKKKSDQCRLYLPDLGLLQDNLKIEKTEFGYWVLPDQKEFGPIYLSRLQKLT